MVINHDKKSEGLLLQIRIAKDPEEWNAIVDKSPFSVLHHRYEFFSYYKNPLPLIVEGRNHKFLFPLRVMELLKSFRLATSRIYGYASILPDNEDALDIMPEALDSAANFLREMKVDYLSLCAPTFRSRPYIRCLNLWFAKRNASVQILYAHMIRIGNATFEEIWKSKFNKRARYDIRRAEREGVNVIEIKTEDDIRKWMEDIYQCNLSALKRQGREGAHPESYKEVYLSELISDKKRLGEYFRIYSAIYRGRLIAYMVVVEYNKFMMVGKLMSHTKFLDKRPNHALFGHVIKEACESGVELFEYGLRRTKLGEKVPSLYPTLEMFFSKFGYEEIPVFVYRLGLTRSGRIMQHLFSGREYVMTMYAYIPPSIRGFLLKLYAPRRRKLSVFLST